MVKADSVIETRSDATQTPAFALAAADSTAGAIRLGMTIKRRWRLARQHMVGEQTFPADSASAGPDVRVASDQNGRSDFIESML
jgi:hypothetical protein